MSSLAQIRTALATTINSAIPTLEKHERVPESLNVPAFMVIPRATEFGKTMGRGFDGYGFDVIVLVSRSDDELAQAALDDYVNGFGAKSIRQAVFNARTLGLADVDATVTGMSEYGAQFEIGSVTYVGARLAVDTTASGVA